VLSQSIVSLLLPAPATGVHRHPPHALTTFKFC